MTQPDDVKPCDLVAILARAEAATRSIGGVEDTDVYARRCGIERRAHDVVVDDVPALVAENMRLRAGLNEAIEELELIYRHERSKASASAMAQVARLRALLPTK